MRLLVLGLLLSVSTTAFAADSSDLQNRLDNTVKPFVGKYCVVCHSGPQPTGQFDLKSYTALDQVKEDFPRWSLLADRLTNHEMPPKQMPQPPQAMIDQIVAFVHAVRAEEIKRLGGDPGTVLARRLSNAEYDNTIRDLTGQDMQVARQFPVDPANTAGFDNSGETLTMSPALLNKYLQARARSPTMWCSSPMASISRPISCGWKAIATNTRSSASSPSIRRSPPALPIISRPPGATAIARSWASRTRAWRPPPPT